MTMAGTRWPTRDEYDIAVARWTETIWDADIRSSTLAYDNMGICRFGGANLYVSIYKIGDWMVRCFCSKPGKQTPVDITERYMAIDRYCRANLQRVSALLPVTYLEQGITVGMRVLPIVKMPFLAGCPSLGEFLMDYYFDRAIMQRLSEAWLRMIGELEAASMAHGDLDLTNVLVQQQGTKLTLKLIDYDNTWIPELAGRGQTEYGHTHFQHPQFLLPGQRPYNVEMDRFSALVIYISLKTLVTHPELYEDWGADESDRLLLSETDYQHAGLAGSRIEQLRQVGGPELYPYIDELSASLREGRMPRSLSIIPYGSLPPQFPAQPAQHTQSPRSTAPAAPARADWRNAVYNANALFATPPSPSQLQPPVQPPAQPMNGIAGNGNNLLATSPWRPMGAYQHAEDAGRPSPSAWMAQSSQPFQPPQPAWSQPPGVAPSPFPVPPVPMPPQPLFPNSYGSHGMQQVPSSYPPAYPVGMVSSQPIPPVQPVQPMPLPQQWNTGMGSSQPAPQFPQPIPLQPSWNSPVGSVQQAPVIPAPQWGLSGMGMGEHQLQAPPLSVSHPTYPTSLPPVNEDDLPMSISLTRGKSSSKKVLTIVVICLLVLVIVVASIVLIMILTGNGHHIGIGDVPKSLKQMMEICNEGKYL